MYTEYYVILVMIFHNSFLQPIKTEKMNFLLFPNKSFDQFKLYYIPKLTEEMPKQLVCIYIIISTYCNFVNSCYISKRTLVQYQ